MRLGVPKEKDNDETRVSIVPISIPKLNKLGFEVIIEKGAGEKSGYSDSARLYSIVNHSKTGGGRTVSLWPYSLDILSGWKPLSHVWMISPVVKSPVAFLTNSLTT